MRSRRSPYRCCAQYPKSSLGCFDRESFVRRLCVRLIEWPWFDRVVLVLILANSVVLALTDYSVVDAETGEPSDKSWRNAVVDKTELFFTLSFTVESALKIMSMGFFMVPGTYLRDGWNVLDFIVVVTGYAALALPSGSRCCAWARAAAAA